MSPAGELAVRILNLLTQGRVIPVSEQMHLRYLAQHDEVALSIEEIARRILARESARASER